VAVRVSHRPLFAARLAEHKRPAAVYSVLRHAAVFTLDVQHAVIIDALQQSGVDVGLSQLAPVIKYLKLEC